MLLNKRAAQNGRALPTKSTNQNLFVRYLFRTVIFTLRMGNLNCDFFINRFPFQFTIYYFLITTTDATVAIIP